MTYLELCQAVARESGVSAPNFTDVVGQISILDKIAEWVKQADLDIQLSRQDWYFLFKSLSSTLVADQKTYVEGDFGVSDIQTPLTILINSRPVSIMDWSSYVSEIRGQGRGDESATTAEYITRSPDDTFYLYPIPNQVLPIEIDYTAKPVAMVNAADVSVIPENYHNCIVQKALMYLSEELEDTMRYQTASINYKQWINVLSRDQKPLVTFS
jgi:hypothetical protein